MRKRIREKTKEKYRAMQARFTHLYDKKRLRIDDAIAQVASEFYMSVSMSEKIILYFTESDESDKDSPMQNEEE